MSFRDTDGSSPTVLLTETIDISSHSTVDIKVDVEGYGGLETSNDYLMTHIKQKTIAILLSFLISMGIFLANNICFGHNWKFFTN